jgi:glycosyltransferase involved in cell wall biosynthesis
MKVIFVNAYYGRGGAARAALRLADALRSLGVEVEYISVYPSDMSVFEKIKYLVRVLFDRLPGLLVAKKRVMFSSGGLSNSRLVSYINKSDADIVHFHWVNAGALSIGDVSRVIKPVFWSLHDMWPITGGCHYSFECLRFTDDCGDCPQLESDDPKDLSFRVLSRKRTLFRGARNITLLGVSEWVSSAARDSSVARGTPVATLPNAIDTSVFFPEHQQEARFKLGLDSAVKIVLFGAIAATTDERKGFSELCTALGNLPDDLDYQLVVFGADRLPGLPETRRPIHFMGHISDDSVLRLIYASADVMVVPSKQETFGLTAAEAMACGTPVVCFATTGLLDIVDHKVNGFAAIPYSTIDLASGICWVLKNESGIDFSEASREKIVRSFSYEVVAKRCFKIYSKKLNLQGDTL